MHVLVLPRLSDTLAGVLLTNTAGATSGSQRSSSGAAHKLKVLENVLPTKQDGMDKCHQDTSQASDAPQPHLSLLKNEDKRPTVEDGPEHPEPKAEQHSSELQQEPDVLLQENSCFCLTTGHLWSQIHHPVRLCPAEVTPRTTSWVSPVQAGCLLSRSFILCSHQKFRRRFHFWKKLG